MEYIKTQEYHTRVDVYFDGEKYVFINAFHGLVAIARREGLVDFSTDGYMAHVKFKIEKSETIEKITITRVIEKQESKYVSTIVETEWEEIRKESLPYIVSVNLEKRGCLYRSFGTETMLNHKNVEL